MNTKANHYFMFATLNVSLLLCFVNNTSNTIYHSIKTDIFSPLILTANASTTSTNTSDYFTIQTLQEHYGDDLTALIYLDESIITYDDLRYLTVLHIGFDEQIHKGELIVNKCIAQEVLEIFEALLHLGFPIEKMQTIIHYQNSDTASMLDNNTSSFNFRMTTTNNKLSMHALGLAIDINPQINPYITETTTLPTNATLYTNRDLKTIGMINESDEIVELFKSYGWKWGGDWNIIKDYQHFEKHVTLP